MKSVFIRVACPLLAGFALAGCGQRLSLENYNKLKAGQTYDEVKQVIGEPDRCDEALAMRSCIWGDEKQGIRVNFVAGKVLILSAKNLK
jgi:hypothetical protein